MRPTPRCPGATRRRSTAAWRTPRVGAYIDSIRAVRVNIYATNGLTGTQEILRALVTTVRIPNAGLTKQRSCGDAPIFARSR